jgi:hypothetical protein
MASPAMGAWVDWVDRWMVTYARDADLWPVAIAILGHVAVAVAGLALVGVRTGSGFAWGLVAGLAAASIAIAGVEIAKRGPGRATVALALTWALGVALAYGADRTGLL